MRFKDNIGRQLDPQPLKEYKTTDGIDPYEESLKNKINQWMKLNTSN